MSRELVIAGTGGSGREHMCVVKDINDANPGAWTLLGFVADQAPPKGQLEAIGGSYLGSIKDECLISRLAGVSFVVGIGNPSIRRQVTQRLEAAGWEQTTLIHPTAIIGPDVHLGNGTVVCAGSVITTSVRVGVSCQVNLSCNISHDVVIGDFVTLTPAVVLTGNVVVEDGVSIGAGACAIPGVRIGAGSVIGAGAVVTHDIPAGRTAVGVPARVLKRHIVD